jgi:hypothetical protein
MACFSSFVQKLVESRSRAVPAQTFWLKWTHSIGSSIGFSQENIQSHQNHWCKVSSIVLGMTLGDDADEGTGGGEVERQILTIAAMPTRWMVASGDVRRSLMKCFPYVILFRIVADDTIRVTVVKHERRHPAFGLFRR